MKADDTIEGGDVSVRLACTLGAAIDTERLRSCIAAAARRLGAPVSRVHLQIVADDAMAAYHRKHSGVAGSTDVLTFLGSEAGAPIDVDIIVCADEAMRRAVELGHDVEREILLYAVHGLLHCAGHDDHDPVAYERMHAEEDRILEAIGVGATFRPGGGGAPGSVP